MKTKITICLVVLCVLCINIISYAEDYVVLNEITESCILDSYVTYYVPNPPLQIHGNIDVVISPKKIKIAETSDYSPAIFVYGNANVSFESNRTTPLQIIGESGIPFQNNYYGIFIDRTAGKKCKLSNVYLEGFYYGIVVDQQLEHPITAYMRGCYNGILSFGPNKIMNSYASYFGSEGTAYCFMPKSMDESIIFGGADFTIKNCLADDGGYGYEAYGLVGYTAPTFSSWDCAATNCYSGFNGWNGYVNFSIICPGLYNNTHNTNLDDSVFTDPVYETSNPLVFDSNDYRIFLNPSSGFVNHGSGLSPLLGWTTRIDEIPDSNVGDIWPHYQTLDNPISADLDAAGVVDTNDLFEFSNYWLVETADPVSADFNKDGIVNLLDYATFANQWEVCEMVIQVFDLETNQKLELNNVSGYVGIGLKNIPLIGQIVSVYLDNLLIGQIQLGWDDEENWVGLESDKFSNGWHTISLASMDIYENVTNHNSIKIYFNNLLYRVLADDQFHPSEDYHFSGFYNGGGTLEAKMIDSMNNQVIWSNTYSGQHISISIPGSTFNNMQLCQLSITEVAGMKSLGVNASGSSGPVATKDLTKKFNQADCPAGIRMVIVMPNKDVFKCRKPAILACAQACNNRNVSWVPLHYRNVTQENLTFLYNKTSVKFVYWCGHADSHVGRNEKLLIEGVPRTHTLCWKIEEGWIWDSYEKQGVFSWTRQTTPYAPVLPNNWDNKGFDLWTLGMFASWNKKIVFVDGCLSAVYADMAGAYGMFSEQGQGSNDQIYIGWRIKVLVTPKGSIWDPLLPSTRAVKMFWEQMGQGKTVNQAFKYTESESEGEAFWGLNGLMDLNLPYDESDDNIWIYGFPGGINTKLEP